jgi:FtsZ-binding cell division protein ZapB
VILEVDTGAIRDLAAALNAARKREPSIEILAQLERKVLHAIQQRSTSIELAQDEAQALRNVLQRRAYDQRNTQEGTDYMDLADRITQDLETDEPPLITTESTNE